MPTTNIVFSFFFLFIELIDLFIYFSHNNIQSLCKITHALHCRHGALNMLDRTQRQMGSI
jgi:hypothetical protein